MSLADSSHWRLGALGNTLVPPLAAGTVLLVASSSPLECVKVRRSAIHFQLGEALHLIIMRSGFAQAIVTVGTALVLNEKRVDTSHDPAREFALLRRHPVYRTAIENGAVEVWMPRASTPRSTSSPPHHLSAGSRSSRTAPLGVFDRSRVHRWLAAMDTAFAPIASWMP